MVGLYLKRALGAVALAAGLLIIAWFIYNQFWPTEIFEESFHSVFQLAIPVVMVFVGWRWLRYQGKGIHEITPPDFTCPELETAREVARRTLPTFAAQVEKGIDGAFIKFSLNTPQGLTEHIWAYVHFFRDGVFNVSIANDPYDRQQETEGRRNVRAEEVEDWQIMNRDGTVQGAHSLIALFRHHESRGVTMTPMMKSQKAQLLDA